MRRSNQLKMAVLLAMVLVLAFSAPAMAWLQVNSPAKDAIWRMGEEHTIQWEAISCRTVNIYLCKGIDDNCSDAQRIVNSETLANNTYKWTVPFYLSPGSDYKFYIATKCGTTGNVIGFSEYFQVSDGTPTPPEPEPQQTQELKNDVPISSQVNSEEGRLYYIDVPTSATILVIKTENVVGDPVDLYIKRDSEPTPNERDARSFSGSGDERIRVDASGADGKTGSMGERINVFEQLTIQEGRYYILVQGANGGGNFTLRAKYLEFNFPFAENGWNITQGYDSGGTHTSQYNSKYSIDFAQHGCGSYGKPILAAEAGRASVMPNLNNADVFGRHIKIDHGDGYTTLYAHLSSVSLFNDLVVEKGQEIGTCGDTGNTPGTTCRSHLGTHLHFTLFKDNISIKPESMSGQKDFRGVVNGAVVNERKIITVDDNNTVMTNDFETMEEGYLGFMKRMQGSNNTTATNSMTWRPDISQAGYYAVYAFIPNPIPNLVESVTDVNNIVTATNVTYQIFDGSAINRRVNCDQSVYRNQWFSLGTFFFKTGSEGYVRLDNANIPQNQYVGFDAVRFIPVLTINNVLNFYNQGKVYAEKTIKNKVSFSKSLLSKVKAILSWRRSTSVVRHKVREKESAFISDLDLLITSPSGKMITPENAEYLESETEDYYIFNVDEEGEWVFEIIGMNIPSDGENYTFEIIILDETPDYTVDTDNDGIPDAWEFEHGLNPLINDASADSDNDGVSNLDEYKAGTDPNDPASKPTINAGIFTVDETGIVKIDWLYDGGMYKGEFGIFSLTGMENLTPGSPEFIAEAVKRVLSNSDQGYLVFSDLQEGARFSGLLGNEAQDWNAGQYRGLKSFAMKPGDKFATILVPNSTFASLSQNPATTDTNIRPLFSLVSDNPGYGTHIGQMADINGMGKAFAYEDMDAATSDWDYNDLIVQITGADSGLPTLDSLVGKDTARSKREKRDNTFTDWRVNSELGKLIMAHIEALAPADDTLNLTVTLKSGQGSLLIYDSQNNMIGKDGGMLIGSELEMKPDGSQTVSLGSLKPGDYRIVIRSTEGGTETLEVRLYEGNSEISSQTVTFDTAAHRTLKTEIPADSLSSDQPITVETPKVPVTAAGRILYYDFNGDCQTGDGDIALVKKLWNCKKGEPCYDPFYDFDNDGRITVSDIMKVSSQTPAVLPPVKTSGN